MVKWYNIVTVKFTTNFVVRQGLVLSPVFIWCLLRSSLQVM